MVGLPIVGVANEDAKDTPQLLILFRQTIYKKLILFTNNPGKQFSKTNFIYNPHKQFTKTSFIYNPGKQFTKTIPEKLS